ncbi:P-loop NTPase fold protein [Nitrosomonas sp. Nm132]|uniref:P-loop NTPase fold protein n=1 Tax=unclassified Nitrosomonas TaxID=2609265 RepID=UPI0008981F55|nr:KAP family P-loop domain-containing protein [Nitrosomonas sp. Nm58]
MLASLFFILNLYQNQPTLVLRQCDRTLNPPKTESPREALEDLLDELGIGFVVFVDDLDRCLPKRSR